MLKLLFPHAVSLGEAKQILPKAQGFSKKSFTYNLYINELESLCVWCDDVHLNLMIKAFRIKGFSKKCSFMPCINGLKVVLYLMLCVITSDCGFGLCSYGKNQALAAFPNILQLTMSLILIP